MRAKEKQLTSQGLEDFLKYLRETEQDYHMAEADEREANDETQDILHAVELDDSAGNKPAQIIKKLRGVRQKRREAKDTIATSAPVVSWCEGNRQVIKALERLLGDVRKQEKKKQTRMYCNRTNIMGD